ncbi:MAG: biotin/lipoyl-binding protein, partial [Desulfovibrionaceae bacterium]|nr:biotin/lipoyl-binding protein [Desulfovibrionaceae bacterium]
MKGFLQNMLTVLKERWAALTERLSKGKDDGRDVPYDILRFQPDSVLLERATPPLGARITLYAFGASIVFLILWSIFGHIDKVVVGQGKLVTASTPVVLQSYSISIIKDIRVHMGQRVKKDDILVVLDPTFAQADMAQLEERITSLTMHLQRLQCELEDKPFPLPPAEGEQKPVLSSSQQREERMQADIYRSRHDEYTSRIRTFDEQRKRLAVEIEAIIADLELRQERLKIYREFEDMREKLYERGIEARAGFLEVKKDRLTVESDALRLQSSIQEMRYELASV